MAINKILNSSVGIDGVLPPAGQETHLPDASEFVSVGHSAKSLDDLFGQDLQHQSLLNALAPKMDRPEQYEPTHIGRCMDQSLDKLRYISNAQVRELVDEVLQPLADNRQLLKIYTGMMVGG
ncbi:MAG: hypothetical protein K6F05_09325 [Succinivibrio sp.]|nr:hypothetical protein [Succinivibrio sp.]